MINRRVFRYIEFELYNYDKTKLELEQEEEDIREGTFTPDNSPVQSKPGDTTATKAVRLTTNTAIVRMTKTLQAINQALSLLDESHNQVFELKYRQNNHWRVVADRMFVSQDTYFKRRRELIEMVALQMGLKLEA